MKERFASIGGIITSIFASACCLGPVALAGLGMAGLGGLFSGLERLRPFFLMLTFISVGLAFRSAYGKNADCTKEKCDPGSRRINRILFWMLVGFAFFGMVSPYIAELL